LSEVKKKAGFLEKEGESIEFWLQPNGLHPKQTDARVNRALGQMDSHFKEADKAPVDEPEQRKKVADQWRSVLYFAKQAEDALETGTPASSLREHTNATLNVIRKKAAAADRDLTMLDRLEDARYAKTRLSNADINFALARLYFYGSAGAELYAKAFRDYGIDVTALDSADAAARVRARPIRRNLVAALNDWYQVNPAADRSGRLLAVADGADDDAVPKRIRAAIDRKDHSELLRIADGPEADSFSPQTALLLASGLETPRDTNDSARVARRALSRHPDDFWLNYLAGMYFLHSDPPRPVEALAAFQAALAARPDGHAVLNAIGITWSLLGDYDRAAAVFSQSLERDKHYLMTRVRLFQALLDSGNLAGAEVAARAWVRDEPDSPAALGSLAGVLHLVGQVEEADRLMKDAIRHGSPDGPDAVFLSQKLTLMGRDEDALPYFRQAAKLAAHHGEFASLLGLALLRTSRRGEAMVELRRGVELWPFSALCWHALADGLASEGKFEEALTADRKALERNPFQSAVRVSYAVHLRRARRPQEALAVAEEAVRLSPRDASALAEQGHCLAGLGRYLEAIRSLELAIRLQPWNGALRESLGDVLRVNHDATSAITAYKEAIRLMPTTARLQNALGNAYFDRKDYPSAIAAYRRAIELHEKAPIFKTNLADTLRLVGQQPEALKLYREAVTLAPDNADVRRTCCTGLYEMGRNDEAIEEGRAAVRLAPAVAASHNVLGIALLRSPA
jgi:eukaryotic-like serine/threonine-protein kinase